MVSFEYIYRVFFKNQITDISEMGYSRDYSSSKGGNMYGAGVYTTYSYNDTIINLKTKPEYGNSIMRMRVEGGFNNFIIFDENLAKKYYGENWDIISQLKALNFSDDSISRIKRNWKGSEGDFYHGRTAPKARILWTTFHDDLFRKGVRGVIYKGNRDGHCALCYDFSSVIPDSVSYNAGKTWNEIPNLNVLKARIKNYFDVHFKYCGRYDTYLKPINGYTVVSKHRKYNIIDSRTDSPISDKWFDYINGQINPSNNLFVFKYNNIDFLGSAEEKYIVDPHENDKFCDFSDLDELVHEMEQSNILSFYDFTNPYNNVDFGDFNDFSDFDNLDDFDEPNDSDDSDGMNENKRILRKIVNECVNQILMEKRTLVDNFDKVAKIMEFNSPDDFYFVQIIKRYKDNKNSDRSKGNYHAGGWYEDSFRVRSVQELMSLKSKIVDLCNKSNARAYITVNNRSEKETNKQVIKVKSMYPKNDARHIHAHEIVPGQAKHGRNWAGQRLKFFVDIDSTDKRIWNEVKKIAKMCDMDIMDEYETPNGGLHIIFPNKEHPNIEYFTQMLKKFDNWIDKKLLATAHPNFDGKILLYSNVESNGY